MWSGIILLKNKARVLQKERQQNSSQNVIDGLLYCKLPLMTSKVVRMSKEMSPNYNSLLRACGACNCESRIGALPWASPDTSSMIVRTQLEVGFIAKYYASSVK
ncbi:hypothetical protein TNCV_928991 [Trichonephila clavipes]|nr:hypothetical protein TNCV_928991 [Trichonephila clavipes]